MTQNFERPDWGPLVDLAPECLEDFMWMFEVEMENGLRIHAYKHRETRRYLHLDHFHRAYVYLSSDELTADDGGRYEEVSPQWLLRLAVDSKRSAIFMGGNVLSEFERVRWARAASRHRIPRRCIRSVLADCRLRFNEPAPDDAPAGATSRFVFLGDDERGRALEVMAVRSEDEEVLQVIHAMELRGKYRLDYEEAQRWRRKRR